MKLCPNLFYLKVQKVEQICLFELSWGHGQTLGVQVHYPTVLAQLYQTWQRAYLSFYQSDHLRGRTVGGGIAAITIDWHAELVKAETKLMYEFHRWLRSAELYDIRARIASASQALISANPNTTESIRVSLTCAPIELDRFPWEAWEIGTEFATAVPIQITRAPLNISAPTETGQSPRRTRILAILGDDTGLNFEADRTAVKSLLKLAEVKFVGWQPEQTPSQLIGEITSAIADPDGWDVLFFAGHSNETAMTGGELGIAPGVSISIREITPQLMAAKKRGLQVAIFNSCSGLTIADSLINLGLSQVVIMREPIHNRVAQEFLVRFLQGLGKHLDVYDSITAARQSLQLEKSHTYPSASLVPSLFCHPGATLFRIPATRRRQWLRQGLPTRIEAIALCAGLVLSGLPPVQAVLQDSRLFAQAVYRNVTAQVSADRAPPVAVVQIDTTSLSRSGITQFSPLDRTYLAKLIDRLRLVKASVVGIDFLLDAPQKDPPTGDPMLRSAVRRAVDQKMWLTFASILEPDGEIGVDPATAIMSSNWALQGYTDVTDPMLVELPPPDCRQTCSIAYLLALTKATQQTVGAPLPQLNRTTDLRSQLIDHAQNSASPNRQSDLLQWRPPLSLQPIVDYSLPPNRVYERIPAWKLLDASQSFPSMAQQVVIIAVGSDERTGVTSGNPDRLRSPSAVQYWSGQEWLTGGEALAYMTQHFLTRHLILPIPDLWLIGAAVLLGKGVAISIRCHSGRWSPTQRWQMTTALVGATAIYGYIGLQLYVSTTAILLPWLFPSSVFLAYVLPATRKKNHV